MTRVLIISNHRMFGSGLESLLDDEPGLEVVGQEKDLEQAIDRMDDHEPDVVIFDSTGPTHECLPAVQEILKTRPGVKVIGLTLYDRIFYVFQALPWSGKQVEDLIEMIKDEQA